jgi:large subunit ribosomal protein L23
MAMRPATDVVRGVLQSEKGTRLAAADQYLLRVASDANKVEIRQAAQELFGVKILKVNTQIGHGKWRRIQARWGRRSDLKKAIVTVAKGQKIEVKS